MLKKKSSLRHTGAFWAFVAPCCILFGIFFLLPLVLSIAFSFTNYDGWKVMDFVGIKNYITLFKDSKFYASMGRTLVYTICCLPFRVIIPLLIAVLVTSPRVRLKSLSRTMIYIPVLMSALVVGITINWMFSQEYGLINFIIQSFGGTPLEWSLNSGLATFVIGFASVWASIGFNMISLPFLRTERSMRLIVRSATSSTCCIFPVRSSTFSMRTSNSNTSKGLTI